MSVTRQECDLVRTELGPECTFADVAQKLGVGVNTVRRRYSKVEQKRWTREMRKARRESYLQAEAKKVLSYVRRTGELPSAEEAQKHAGVSSHAMRVLGGWSAIVKAAGLTPRKPGRPKDQPKLPPPPQVRHWQ